MGDMRAIQHDVKSLLFSDFASVVAALPPAQLSRDAAQWQSQLLSWDGQSTVGSTEASVFNTFMAGLASLTNSETLEYTRDFRFLLSVFNGSVTEPDCGSSCQQFAVEQFNKAVATAKRERWGQSGLHQALFQHLVLGESPLACLANRCVDKAGDQETINVGPFAFNETDFRVLHGSRYAARSFFLAALT
jgi:penicillin amidase